MISNIIWDIDPRIFSGFEFFRWYGVCWVLGMLLGYKIMLNVYRSEDISHTELDKLTIYVMLGAILGARFGHILFYDPVYYLENPIEILPIRIKPTFQFTGLAGLASHGGILGTLFALYLYNRKFKRNYFRMLDRLMIAGAALGGFIRLGNLMNSEIIGTPSNLPWAFIFTRVDQIPRHPAQLYEAIFYFGISIVLYFVWKSKKFYEHIGFIFGLGMTLIFAQRFLIEFLKENQVPFEENLTLNMGQTLSIPLILGGVVLMIWSLKSSIVSCQRLNDG
jgi:prolipoprotein diacylglyceryl transferase